MNSLAPVVLRGCAVVLALTLAGCADSAAPEPPFTSFAGQWATQDTFRWNYYSRMDSTQARLHILVNQASFAFVAVSDSTYTFNIVSVSQQVLDSTAGSPAVRQTINAAAGPSGSAVVRGDTAYLDYFPRMPLGQATATSVTSQRIMPTSECVSAVGPIASPRPAPTCYVAYHWIRTH